jgi:8-oxo-dGTP diphosphatase
MDTVEPYALERHLAQQQEASLSETGYAAQPEQARKRVRSILEAGGRSLICSHRPVVPALLDELLGADQVASLMENGLPPSALVAIHHLAGELLGIERVDP